MAIPATCTRILCRGVVVSFALLMATPLTVVADDAPTVSNAWQTLREQMYGDKDLGVVDEQFMSIDAPANTPDPSDTPITLHFARDPARAIRQVRVFIDNNPSPIAATFKLSDIPVSQIDMRVRIDRYTSVRAVAELSNGNLEMRSVWVKAAGGCSAPPGVSAGGKLGEIKLRPSIDASAIQVSIHHPNNSGFQIDPRTGSPIPQHFIAHLRVDAASRPLIDADLGISISENPTLRIVSDKPLPGPLTVDAVDSQTQAHYTASLQSPPAANPDKPGNGP